MKILVAIAHYFDAKGDGKYMSTSPNALPRLEACRSCITALHRLFGRQQYQLDIARWCAVPVNSGACHELDIRLCTSRKHHLVAQLALPATSYRHVPFDVESMMLEFKCQSELRNALGNYDYYCFMEDDLIIHDPHFFQKLVWFNQTFTDECLLQPNRFEVGTLDCKVPKLYIDGNLPPASTAPFQDISVLPELRASFLGAEVHFVRPLNPHSGCYFLTESQMARFASQAHFLNRDTSWCGPLESAATLGIMKTFRIYKPSPQSMGFLEMEHKSNYNILKIGKEVPIESDKKGMLKSLLRGLKTNNPQRQRSS